ESEGVTVLVVVLRPCMLPPSLSRFQALNAPSRPLSKLSGYQREELWVKVANAIVDALQEKQPTTPPLVVEALKEEHQVAPPPAAKLVAPPPGKNTAKNNISDTTSSNSTHYPNEPSCGY
ncbi:MAG TPA: hypothetical protein VH593_17885, partial [Ktedonobacteraceae bacterium]